MGARLPWLRTTEASTLLLAAARPWTLLSAIPSETEPHPARGPQRRPWGVKRRVHDWKFAVHRWQGACNKGSTVAEASWRQLSCRVVAMIQQIINLPEQLNFAM